MALLYPVLAQILFTLVMILAAGRARVRAAKAGRVRLDAVALSSDAWPDDVRKIANNMNNQFQTPILFYALCGIAVFVGAAGWLMVALAWIYVAARIVHSYVHVTANDVVQRLYAFAAGMAALALMWLVVLFRILSV